MLRGGSKMKLETHQFPYQYRELTLPTQRLAMKAPISNSGKTNPFDFKTKEC